MIQICDTAGRVNIVSINLNQIHVLKSFRLKDVTHVFHRSVLQAQYYDLLKNGLILRSFVIVVGLKYKIKLFMPLHLSRTNNVISSVMEKLGKYHHKET